jgi:glycosyltransferase involved in cell wall biosynthesis
MFVKIKKEDESHIHGPRNRVREALAMARVVADSVPLWLHSGTEGAFSVDWIPDSIPRKVDRIAPDVVHLNWVGDGFLNIKSIGRLDRPVIWRLPDMWAFTGGCHYADGCERYRDSCGQCPKLESTRAWDISRWTWRRKSKGWRDAEITVVAPSSWLADRARESSLFCDRRIEVIPNGLDTDVYSPTDPELGRRLFGLPKQKRLILFGAQATDDPRKGFGLLRHALERLEDRGRYDDVALVVFGASEPEDPPDLGFEQHYTGYVNDDQSLSLLYGAADVMVVPSKYEGFGQTVTEAMACGTPVVAFDVSGPRDTVDHEETGYLATPYDTDDLADGIAWLLDDPEAREALGVRAREKTVKVYHLEAVAKRYRALYETVV